MTATGPITKNPVLRTDDAFLAEPVHEETPRHKAYRYILAATRLSLGWVFLWAFLDKTFALGFGTGRDAETGVVDRFGDAAWINGGSPTEGFLKFGADGPFKGFYNDIAGAAWADWLFMLGLLGIGTRPDARHHDADRRGAGVAAAGDDVDRRPASGEQPVHGRPPDLRPGAGPAGAHRCRPHARASARMWERLPFVQRYGFLK